MATSTITMTIDGRQYKAIPEAEYQRLTRRQSNESAPPKLPRADKRGGREAFATMAALIGQDVRKARTAAGLTQEQLARQAGVRSETISRIESAKHTPSPSTMRKINKVLGDQ